MNKRPRLNQAIDVLKSLVHISEDAAEALADYEEMRRQGMHFQAARMVVDIVDQHFKTLDEKGIAHG
jgi:hypothetical protein